MARNALDSVGLGDRYDHRPAELSGGQQQRVAVARAFVHSPDVILCDEPTGNLDSRTSDEIMDLLIARNRDEGVTLVIVTHDEEIAARCHRVLHMSDGMMVSEEG